jgi:hypothetical protein
LLEESKKLEESQALFDVLAIDFPSLCGKSNAPKSPLMPELFRRARAKLLLRLE